LCGGGGWVGRGGEKDGGELIFIFYFV
jgi:hypothetical protein